MVDEFRTDKMQFRIDLEFRRGDEFLDCGFGGAEGAGDETGGFGVLLKVGMLGWVWSLGFRLEGKFGGEFFGEEVGLGRVFVVKVRRRLNLVGTFTF